ncbi:hypothetical protein ACH4TV_34535 [Streptomyces sp. NPDC020898]|uniref:hypothetical protein n=1 Tax=Streptomyces sp. NPDC020898 TaxID=3365101 RepID=UPI0037893F0B
MWLRILCGQHPDPYGALLQELTHQERQPACVPTALKRKKARTPADRREYGPSLVWVWRR